MIEGGKVHYNGSRAKPGKIVETGALIGLWQGFVRIEVVVRALSDRRGNAAAARLLYEETPESLARREERDRERRAGALFAPHPESKPDKKQRRQLLKIKHGPAVPGQGGPAVPGEDGQ